MNRREIELYNTAQIILDKYKDEVNCDEVEDCDECKYSQECSFLYDIQYYFSKGK